MDPEYLIIGVSGSLQDGFPLHTNLDYRPGELDESKGIFIGKALVRGYKAYLDVMQDGWRQYSPEPKQPLINSNVFASGCYEHANEYWLYFVDARQLFSVLANEPRFLSITPDTGLIDLAAEETDDIVRDLLTMEIRKQVDKTNLDHVAVPLVTAVWYNFESHVPSPPIRVKEDGTQITNYADSLALWAGVNDTDRTAVIDYLATKRKDTDSYCAENQACSQVGDEDPKLNEAKVMEKRYWDGIRLAIRRAEENRPRDLSEAKDHPPYQCETKVRFGVGTNAARVNYRLTKAEIVHQLLSLGYEVDFTEGEMKAVTTI